MNAVPERKSLAEARRMAQAPIYVDHTHCGRHVTGLERITLELFSAEALHPLDVNIVTATDRRAMLTAQWFGLPRHLLADRRSLVLCPGFPPSAALTLFGARVIPYIHDLFLITRRADLNARAKLYMAKPFRFAVERLPRFLVNSRTTADELRRFARPDASIHLYRPQVRNVFALTAAAQSARPTETGQLRFVALGTVEPRKNLLAAAALIAALRARGSDARLDIIGREGWGRDASMLADMPGVVLHGYQPAEAARKMIEASDFLLSTSHDEGLGLPLLEVQYAGLAVIAPDKPVFREVLATSGLLIDTADPTASADRIMALVQQNGWRAHHAALAQANIARWNAAAATDRAQVLTLLSQLAHSGAM